MGSGQSAHSERDSYEKRAKEALKSLAQKKTDIDKFLFLTHLRVTDVHFFYRLLLDNFQDLTPLIYTPTIGDACLRWSEIYAESEGYYLRYSDKGNIRNVIKDWHLDADITVVTDGSRILGLGDLGANGMGIPIGKLVLYSACAGIRPERTLPVTLDLGTANKALLEDPIYKGARHERISGEREIEFLDEVMLAFTERWPSMVIQYEDFKNPFEPLERYQNKYIMFNDDVQGTGAVILGGFIAAVKASGIDLHKLRAVFFGAGSAGVGVARQLLEFFIKQGVPEEEARDKFWLVDSKGLITTNRGDALPEHKVYFARRDNGDKQYKTLAEVVDYVRPNILIGLSTVGGAFTPEILEKMATVSERPIIFPLSNPLSKSECTFEDAIRYTEGRCLFASGSPFHPFVWNGKTYIPGQGNNMYVFPGIGLGAILSKTAHVTQDMIYASGLGVSQARSREELQQGLLYPDVGRIREVSVIVTRHVIRAAQESKVDREANLRDLSDEELDEYIRRHMYNPAREPEAVGLDQLRRSENRL